MGVFNQFSSFIKNYGRQGTPAAILNSLRSPKIPWEFTPKHEKALDDLKRIVTQKGDEAIHLFAPDHTQPLILETDGSEDGWGAVLYQKNRWREKSYQNLVQTVKNGSMVEETTVPQRG